MNIPFLVPSTRQEALSNAVYYASEADRNMEPGGVLTRVEYFLRAADAWSRIALSFPEGPAGSQLEPWKKPLPDPGPLELLPDTTVAMTLPPVKPSVGHVIASGRPPGVDGTLVVDAVAWDVLRTLGIRYVLGSINKGVTIDLNEEDTEAVAWDLQFTRMPDSSVIHVSVHRP